MVNDDDGAGGVRLDVWLDVACLFRTRSEAQKACRAGKVTANGQSAKPNRHLRVGDELVISRPLGRKQLAAERSRWEAFSRAMGLVLTPVDQEAQ